MKYLIVFLAMLAFADEPKKPDAPETKGLSRAQLVELDLITAQEKPVIDAINKVAEMALTPFRDKRIALYAAACKETGWPEGECQIAPDLKSILRTKKEK